MAYNWKRSDAGERVIPISIEGDRPTPSNPYPHPPAPSRPMDPYSRPSRPVDPFPSQPTDPYSRPSRPVDPYPSRPADPYRDPPAPPTRRHYGREEPDVAPNYPPPPPPVVGRPTKPAPPIKDVGRGNSSFRSHDLDEMDALAEMLKQKREADNKPKSDTNPYRNYYAENTEASDSAIPEEPPNPQPPSVPDMSVGGSSTQMGFFTPAAPESSASNTLPYPVAGSGGGVPYPPLPSGSAGFPYAPPPVSNYPNPYQ